MKLIVEAFVANEGTILVFAGRDADGIVHTFAADHRPGADIVAALADGVDDIEVDVPSYLLLGEVQ